MSHNLIKNQKLDIKHRKSFLYGREFELLLNELNNIDLDFHQIKKSTIFVDTEDNTLT